MRRPILPPTSIWVECDRSTRRRSDRTGPCSRQISTRREGRTSLRNATQSWLAQQAPMMPICAFPAARSIRLPLYGDARPLLPQVPFSSQPQMYPALIRGPGSMHRLVISAQFLSFFRMYNYGPVKAAACFAPPRVGCGGCSGTVRTPWVDSLHTYDPTGTTCHKLLIAKAASGPVQLQCTGKAAILPAQTNREVSQ